MSWDKNKPSGNMPLNASDDAIRENWAALEEALSKEHYFPDNDPDKFGRHTDEFIQSIIDRINMTGGTTNATHADSANEAIYAQNASNSDKVDNFDASQVRQPQVIPVSDNNGYLNYWIKQGFGSNLDADKVRGLPADFTCIKDFNGYTKLPNDLVFQWGRTNNVDGDNEINVNFPVSFPRECFTVVAVADVPFNTDQWVTVRDVNKDGFTARMEYYAGNKAQGTIRWMAIGY